jgi:hypothetical protein
LLRRRTGGVSLEERRDADNGKIDHFLRVEAPRDAAASAVLEIRSGIDRAGEAFRAHVFGEDFEGGGKIPEVFAMLAGRAKFWGQPAQDGKIGGDGKRAERDHQRMIEDIGAGGRHECARGRASPREGVEPVLKKWPDLVVFVRAEAGEPGAGIEEISDGNASGIGLGAHVLLAQEENRRIWRRVLELVDVVGEGGDSSGDETALAAQVALRDLSFQRLYLASQIIEAASDEDLEGGGAVFEQPKQQGEDGESCADDWNHTADDTGDGTDRLESTDEIFLVRRRHANAVKDIVEFIAALRVITVRKGFGEAAERLCQGVEIDGKPPARGAIHRLARHGSVGQHTAAVHVKATTQVHAEFRHDEDFPTFPDW